MTPEQLLKEATSALDQVERLSFNVVIKVIDDDEQIVYGEVYAPNIIDTHGDMMLPGDVKLLCHRFMERKLSDRIDIMHNNKPVNAYAVECFIARAGDPQYTEGAWVVATKIEDKDLWAEIKSGKYNGYSMEALVRKVDAVVEITYLDQVFGFTEENDGHHHAFFVELNENGKVIGGRTSEDEGHYHVIRYGTATEPPKGDEKDAHQHRYFLP